MNDNLLAKAYTGKKVLVTGHTGFKGSWLSIWLKSLGANVIGFALAPPTEPSNFIACDLKDHITHINGDVRDLDHVLATFKEHKPEIVFHLAAQPIVRYSYSDPKLTFDTNIGGTVNILESMRLTTCVKAFVNITSDKCYDNKEWVWGYRENDPMGGDDPYSASKGCCELVFSSYLKSFFSNSVSSNRQIGLASVRAGNVIGGGDWAKDRLIPDCVRATVTGETIAIRNPGSVRPWQHVLEPLAGYLWIGALLLEDPQSYNGSWNFGPSQQGYLPVYKVVDKFIQLWGEGGRWKDISDKTQKVHEASLLRLNCDKTNTLLEWRSVLQLDECLQFTVDWYKQYYSNNSNMGIYNLCKEQIKQYVDKAYSRGLAWSR